MIYVDRSRVPAPSVLTDPALEKGGVRERAAAVAFYAIRENRGKSFPFEAYAHHTVRTALAELFQNKCAYCESPFMGTSDLNVEHWRPKGAVITTDPTVPKRRARSGPAKAKGGKGGKDGKGRTDGEPGYYWLAAAWENLLPSCQHCNQARQHEIEGRKVTLGKKEQFPLAPGSPRARAPGEEANEVPLLLNPCADKHPEVHLEFAEDEDGRGQIRPRMDPNGQPSGMGQASILVYALPRPLLKLERRKRFMEIEERIASVRRQIQAADATSDPVLKPMLESNVRQELESLKRFMEPQQPFVLMATQIIQRFLATVTP